jgi:SNF2 family DNA or RNA helicase
VDRHGSIAATALKKYQQEGVEWLKTKSHALLADEMGLGKTCQAIIAANSIGVIQVLIACPAIARENWRRECLKWSAQFEPCIVSYEAATNNVASLTLKHWDLLIVDESHYCKERTSQRTQSVLGILSHYSNRVWCLSGTPSPNHAGELWPMLMTFGATQLDYDSFVRMHCYGKWDRYSREWKPTGTKAPAAVAQILKPLMLRRTVAEVMPELPPLDFHDMYVEPDELPSDVMAIYFSRSPAAKVAEDLKRDLEKAAALGQDGIEAAFDQLPTLRRWLGANKVASVASLVKQELDAGAYDKIVLWAYHRQVVEGLAGKLNQYKVSMVHGSMTEKRKWQEIDAFNNGKNRVQVAQYGAAGTAVTFNAREMIFVEYDWNPAVNLQAAKRCYRAAAGVPSPVRARFAIIPGGVDDVVLAVARRKTRETAGIYAVSAPSFIQENLLAFG